jgi:hypothetical protein
MLRGLGTALISCCQHPMHNLHAPGIILARRRLGLGWVLISTLLSSLAGCGGNQPPPVVPVSGRITLDGKPLSNAEVNFAPLADSRFPCSVARTDEQGRYSLHLSQDTTREGAVTGDHRVVISISPQQKPKASPRSKSKFAVRSRSQFDESSATQFGKFIEKCAVPSDGTTQANFELTSK